MLTYRAMYKYLDGHVHAEVLDYCGVISVGTDLESARRMLSSALVDMAETDLSQGRPLPKPDPTVTDAESDLEEPIHLLLRASTRVELIAQDAQP